MKRTLVLYVFLWHGESIYQQRNQMKNHTFNEKMVGHMFSTAWDTVLLSEVSKTRKNPWRQKPLFLSTLQNLQKRKCKNKLVLGFSKLYYALYQFCNLIWNPFSKFISTDLVTLVKLRLVFTRFCVNVSINDAPSLLSILAL